MDSWLPKCQLFEAEYTIQSSGIPAARPVQVGGCLRLHVHPLCVCVFLLVI